MHVFLSIIKTWSAHFPQSDLNLNYVSFFFFFHTLSNVFVFKPLVSANIS